MMLYNGYGEHIDHGLSALLVFVEMKPALKHDVRLKKLLEDFSREEVERRGILFSSKGGSVINFPSIPATMFLSA